MKYEDDFVELSESEFGFLRCADRLGEIRPKTVTGGHVFPLSPVFGLDGHADRLPSGEPGPGRLIALGLVRKDGDREYLSLVNPGRLFRCEGKLWRAVFLSAGGIGYVSLQKPPKSPHAVPMPPPDKIVEGAGSMNEGVNRLPQPWHHEGAWSDLARAVLEQHGTNLAAFKEAAAMVAELQAQGGTRIVVEADTPKLAPAQVESVSAADRTVVMTQQYETKPVTCAAGQLEMTPERAVAYLRLIGLGAIVDGKMTDEELRAFFERDRATEGGTGLAETVKWARDILAKKAEEE